MRSLFMKHCCVCGVIRKKSMKPLLRPGKMKTLFACYRDRVAIFSSNEYFRVTDIQIMNNGNDKNYTMRTTICICHHLSNQVIFTQHVKVVVPYMAGISHSAH